MRVMTWNVRRATAESPVWTTLLEIAPDIALLQEVGGFPPEVASKFDVRFEYAIGKTGRPQKFGTAVLVRGKITGELRLVSEHDWVNREINFFSGNLVGCVAAPEGCSPKNVISVYSPAWPVDKSRLIGIDVSPVKLQNNPDVWCTEILWSGLTKTMPFSDGQWVVGGDFNSSETFDFLWAGGPHGNKEILDRMNDLGLTECLKSYNGELIPTFRNSSNGKIIHQLDHLFVTDGLSSTLEGCITGDASDVFDKSLSDHLPVIGDFV